MANTYIYRDYNSAPTNGNKATFSMWVKRNAISSGSRQKIIGAYDGGSAGQYLEFNTDDTIRYHSGSGGAISSTNAKFRDCNGWYHIVVQHDTTGSGTSDQVKIYVNGELQSMANNYGASVASQFGKNSVKAVLGAEESSYSSQYYDGLISHFHFIDGTIYAPTVFGSTDSTTGEWKINTSPSVTYGTNGCFLFKDDNSLNDDSTNSNNFTLGNGTFTKIEDCPSNVFCTLNPLGLEQWTLSNGNLSISGASDNQMMIGTMHSDAGYYEVKMTGTSHGSGGKGARIGLCKVDGSHAITYSGISGNSGDLEKFIGVQTANGNYRAVYNNGYTVTDYSSDSWSQNDILQVAWKNNKIWYGVNGTWLGSGNPSSGTNEADTLTSGSMYVPAIISSLAGADGSQFNFGNGYFGTTAISSEGTNASSIGKFEYDVPTGCTAVSTKGLNE